MKIRLSELRRLIHEEIIGSEDILKPLADLLAPLIVISSEIYKKQKEFETIKDYYASAPLYALLERVAYREIGPAIEGRFLEVLGKDFYPVISMIVDACVKPAVMRNQEIKEPSRLDDILKSVSTDARDKFTTSLSEIVKRATADIKNATELLRSGLEKIESEISGKKKALEDTTTEIRSAFNVAVKKAAEVLASNPRILDVVRTAQKRVRIPALEKAGLDRLAISIRDALGQDVTGKDMNVGTLVQAFNRSLESRMKQSLSGGNARAEAEELLSVLEAVPKFSQEVMKLISTGSKKIDSTAEAPEGAELGRIAFAPLRKGRPFEPNTRIEEDLLNDLRNHVDGKMFLDSKSAKLIQSFMAKGWYPEVFRPSSSGTVYRGMSVDRKWVKANLGVEKLSEKSTIIDRHFVYKSSGGSYASSWSSSFKIAKEFAIEQQEATGEVADFIVVIQAEVDENPDKFLDTIGVYDSIDMSEYRAQKEQIGFGDIRASKATIWRGGTFPSTGVVPGYGEKKR